MTLTNTATRVTSRWPLKAPPNKIEASGYSQPQITTLEILNMKTEATPTRRHVARCLVLVTGGDAIAVMASGVWMCMHMHNNSNHRHRHNRQQQTATETAKRSILVLIAVSTSFASRAFSLSLAWSLRPKYTDTRWVGRHIHL
jgi:hypothetical protein